MRPKPTRVELLQGTLDLLILRTLLTGPTHGHAIAKHIQRTSEDLLQVETGSLYPALHRLEAKGWVAASWELSDMGNGALVQESTRDTWGWTGLEQLGQDLRYAFRTMASNRLFTLLAVMSLALGIGANTAIYSFMDWILMRSLPVHDPDSLVVMNWRAKIPRRLGDGKVWHSMSGSIYGDPKSGLTAGIFPFPVFDLFHKSDSLFSSVFAFCPAGSLNLTTESYSDLVRGEYVTGDYFLGLGVAPAAGRLVVADDDRAGAPAVAVMSFALSQRRFGGAEAALGQSIRINNVPFTVAGVTPPEFFGVKPADVPDLYVPMQASLLLEADPTTPPGSKFLERNYYWLERSEEHTSELQS